jgi:hypothetical protein
MGAVSILGMTALERCKTGCFHNGDYEECRRVASSGMLNRVALVRTDVSEELSASIIRVTIIGELGT